MSVWEALGDLDRGQPRMGEQLICALREAIDQGKLTAGARLPSSRDLAADLGVSRGLVVGVYERLIAEGRLAARRGSGTVVTGQADPAEADLAGPSTIGRRGADSFRGADQSRGVHPLRGGAEPPPFAGAVGSRGQRADTGSRGSGRTDALDAGGDASGRPYPGRSPVASVSAAPSSGGAAAQAVGSPGEAWVGNAAAQPGGFRVGTSGAPPDGSLLRPGLPDLGLFPRTAWRRAYERALTRAADTDFDYGHPAGAFQLRAELAAYLSRTRVARADVDRLVVTSGATQAFALVAQVLRGAGATTIGVEDPGSRRSAGCFDAHGVRPVAVPVDAAGIDVAALERTGVPAVLVTPAHQYPTGVVLAPQRRAALLDWARRTNAVIVEDDYDAEFRFDREPVGSLQGLAPEHVILVGSVSRTIAPALRLGWLVSPRGWREALCEAKRNADGCGPAIEQLAFAELLAGAAYDRHLRRVKRTLRERRDVLVTAIRHNLPSGRIVGVAAGLHLVVELPDDVDDAALAERARSAGLAPLALSSLRVRPGGPSGLVLGYAAHSPSALVRAVRTLIQVSSNTTVRTLQPPGPV